MDELPIRKPMRLKNYDYNTPGAYSQRAFSVCFGESAGNPFRAVRGRKMIDRRRLFVYNIVCIHLQEERELK